MTKTAAVYARYSTDLQNDQSVEDQITYCRELAKRYGFRISEKHVFFDRAKSATTMFHRDGLLSLMKAAEGKGFQVVISENLSRLSRDQEDLPHIYKRLSFEDIKIWTNEGEVDELKIGIRSIIGSQQVKDGADQVRRHHDARVREGKIPGAVAYGHRCVPGKKMEREIDPDKARVVKRIFTEYTVLNKSTRQIAEGLTRDGIKNPSGGDHWNHQVFTSNSARSGLLTNQIYIGRLIWNKTRGVRSPHTGNVVRRANKPETIITTDVPHLRIIDQALWDRTQALIKERAQWRFGPTGKRPKSKSGTLKASLLSGLIICGKCGGQMILTSSRRLTVSGGKLSGPFAACSAAHYHGACDHRKSYDVAKLERVVLKGMKAHLTDPAALLEATKAYHARWSEMQNEGRATRAKLQAEIDQIDAKLNRIVDAITDSDTPMEALKVKLRALEVERATKAGSLGLIERETSVVTLHPATIDKFKSDIDHIHAALSGDITDELARIAFRDVFERFVVHPTLPRMDYEVTPYARLSSIMGVNLFPKIRTVEEVVQEQRIGGSDLAGRTSPTGQNWTSDLICLGRWKQAA